MAIRYVTVHACADPRVCIYTGVLFVCMHFCALLWVCMCVCLCAFVFMHMFVPVSAYVCTVIYVCACVTTGGGTLW